MTAPARFRQADITRAIRAAKAAGAAEVRVEIEPGGKIIIMTGRAAAPESSNPWDEVI